MSSLNSFGRIVAPPDARDLQYSMRAMLPQVKTAAAPKPRQRPYNDGPLLDQGQTPQCVGYSARGFLDAAPIMSKPAEGPSATELYKGAQVLDEWSGEDYDGTSVRGVMKYMSQLGIISSYAWGQTLEDAIKWMNGGYGTIIVGTYWYSQMSNVDANGFMLEPPASMSWPLGGHAYRWIWYDSKKKGILMRNSWGNDFGFVKKGVPSGYAYMSLALCERLLREYGEIAAPTQVKLTPVKVA